MSAADTLTNLLEGATPGPVVVDDANYELVATDTNPYGYVANFCPHDFSKSEMPDDEIKANAKLYTYLRNNAEAIRDLIVAAEEAAQMQIVEQWKLREAIAKIKEQP